jgi:hypothetical protein
MAVVVVLAVGVALLVARQGRVATDRARARTAADAAALAAAGQDDSAARVVAQRNGATVVSIRRLGSQVEVEIVLGAVRATSRAARTG